MALFLVFVLSWAVAVATYVALIGIASGRLPSVADIRSLALWGGVMVTFATPLTYLPAMFALKARVRSRWPFPVAGALLGTVPLLLFALMWGANPMAALLSTGSWILIGVFAAFGVTFGIGFHRIFGS